MSEKKSIKNIKDLNAKTLIDVNNGAVLIFQLKLRS